MALGIDRPLQGLDDVAEMLAHGGLTGIRIPASQGFDDGLVLAQPARGSSRPVDRPVVAGCSVGAGGGCGRLVREC